MSNILWSMVAGALAGLASCIALLGFNFVRASQTTGTHKAMAAPGATALPTPPEATAPSTPPPPQSPAPHAGSAPVPDTIAAILPPLAKTLSPLAEEVSHPRELLDMREFQAVVEAFRRPDATMARCLANML
jgi:hypothetical protein